MKTLATLLLAMICLQAVAQNDIYTATNDSKLTWTGKRVTYGHHGSVDLKSGSLEFKKGTLIGGEFVVDMTSIRDLDLDDEQRAGRLVGHLKSDDFFSVETYPETLFSITKVKKQKSESGNYMITGLLTIRGKTNEESFPAQIDVDGNRATASGTVVFDRTKYDVKYGSGSFFDDLGDKMIHDEIAINVELVATKE